MKKQLIKFLTLVMVALLTLSLAGCGNKQDELSEAVVDSNKKPEKEISEDKPKRSKKKNKANQKIEDDKNDKEDGLDALLGSYVYLPGDEQEERVFEIGKVAGNYYIEYFGYYDYAAGELELQEVKDDQIDVIIYAYSGFSFAGDYQGPGNECTIRVNDNGDITLSKGQPFLDYGELKLIKDDTRSAHFFMHDAEENSEAKELIGTWRCISERDGEVHEITLVFGEDGTFKAYDKQKDLPPNIYVGNYRAEGSGEDIAGDVEIQLVAYGNQPDAWVLEYDSKQACPVVYSDYMWAEPFTYKEEDKNLPFKKIDDKKVSEFTPGPGERTDEITKSFNEYRGISENDYENDGDADLDDVIKNAKKYTDAPIVEIDSISEEEEGRIITLHCYEVVGEGNNAHTATWDWIYYNESTGVYTDFFGNVLN